VRFVVPSVDLRRYRPVHSATRLLTKQYCEQHVIVPVSVARGVLIGAMVDPENQAALTEEVALLTSMKVEVVRASVEEIEDTIAACYGAPN
jgi:Type II secretion system (T2SS), protein E, N-terminal domain